MIGFRNKTDFFFSRWEVIANYMNLHSTSQIKRTAKDVINKAKNLQRLGEKHITVVNGFRLHVEEHNHFYFRKDKIS